jgi:hypothetical protein
MSTFSKRAQENAGRLAALILSKTSGDKYLTIEEIPEIRNLQAVPTTFQVVAADIAAYCALGTKPAARIGDKIQLCTGSGSTITGIISEYIYKGGTVTDVTKYLLTTFTA